MALNIDWAAQLIAVLRQHNHRHADGHKGVSHATVQARAQGLMRSFRTLRGLGYQLGAQGLNGRHIAALVDYWTAAPLPPPPPGRKVTVARLVKPLSPAYIQQQLSFLRVYSEWIGKHGMVLPASRYVSDPALVERSYTADADKGWATQGIDEAAVIAAVARLDPYVGVQLELMWAFGLRRKEAVMFNPDAAEVPAWAVPLNQPLDSRYVSHLRVRRGTKGGRLRYTAVRNAAQRDALARAKALARGPQGHVGRPGQSLKQALARFSNVMHKLGLTRQQLGVTGHGLRHQFAGDLYFELTGMAAPVRGGEGLDAAAMREAYLEVARQLGHNRPQISNAYLGSPARCRLDASTVAQAEHSSKRTLQGVHREED